jgi:hypothetical protein
MKIILGKKEPTDIEQAMLEAIGLGEIKINAAKEYYLEITNSNDFSTGDNDYYVVDENDDFIVVDNDHDLIINNNIVTMQGEPIIHQQVGNAGNILASNLDMNGICRYIMLKSKLDLHQKLISNIVDFQEAMHTIQVLQQQNPNSTLTFIGETEPQWKYFSDPMYSTYTTFSDALDKLERASQVITRIKQNHPEIYQMNVENNNQAITIPYINSSSGKENKLKVDSFSVKSLPEHDDTSVQARLDKLASMEREKLDTDKASSVLVPTAI